jgi:citrate lyase subunit beta / citryl-CoA lyase
MELSHVRSLLFAPGSDGAKLAKALSSEADAVVCDLEDAVAPPDEEAEAR